MRVTLATQGDTTLTIETRGAKWLALVAVAVLICLAAASVSRQSDEAPMEAVEVAQ